MPEGKDLELHFPLVVAPFQWKIMNEQSILRIVVAITSGAREICTSAYISDVHIVINIAAPSILAPCN